MEAAAALSAEQPARAPAKHPIVYRVREYDPVDVPLSDLLNAKGRLRLNPDVESKGYFTVQLTKGAVRLQARGYVGLIPLNDRVVIDVKPRVESATSAICFESPATSRRLWAPNGPTRQIRLGMNPSLTSLPDGSPPGWTSSPRRAFCSYMSRAKRRRRFRAVGSSLTPLSRGYDRAVSAIRR